MAWKKRGMHVFVVFSWPALMISVYLCLFIQMYFQYRYWGIRTKTINKIPHPLIKPNLLTAEGCGVYTAILQSAIIRCQADVYLALATHQMCPITLLEDRMTRMTMDDHRVLSFSYIIVLLHVGGFGPIFDFSCVCCRKQSAASVEVFQAQVWFVFAFWFSTHQLLWSVLDCLKSLTHQGTHQRLWA